MLPLDLSTLPDLRTAQLLLRAVTQADAPAVFALRSDPVAMRFVPRPLARTLDDARAHIDNIHAEQTAGTSATWAITRHTDPAMIGIIGLFRIQAEHHRAELGYMLLPAHWGQGLMREAIEAVVRHAFHGLGFHSIEAVVDPQNTASIRVLEHNGFVREGLFHENMLHNGTFHDSAVYSKLTDQR